MLKIVKNATRVEIFCAKMVQFATCLDGVPFRL